MFDTFVGIFWRGGCTISKPRNTHKGAAERHNTLQTMAIEGVKRQLLYKWPRGLPHLRELLLLFCACVHAGANSRPNLETTSGEEIPCPDS